MVRIGIGVLLLLPALATPPSFGAVERHDFYVKTDGGIRLFVREVQSPATSSKKQRFAEPILLIHGARVPGLASFDLPVAGGSLAADFAERGFDVFIVDIRGYGKSTRPREMDEPPSAHPPLVRSNEAARDIAVTVDWIRRKRSVAKVALFGWATGGQWAGYYASLYPDRVSALVVLNSLYRGASPHPVMGHGSDMEDPEQRDHFNQKACGAYRLNEASSLLGGWDRSIPETDKSLWRDPSVAQAYVAAALQSDSTSSKRTPPSFRSPCGPLEDSFYLATGRQLCDASLITAPTLILASERDFWSRPEDRRNLAADLVHSAKVQTVVIPGATHFVHLDRAERGRDLLLQEVASFLALLRAGRHNG
jgi:pimeloyl-ACP methyl ester carboxylesterase